MKVLKILIIVLTVFALKANAQTQYKNIAIGGGNGIYISTGYDFPSRLHPVKNATAYIIERKLTSENEWTIIGNISAPDSIDDFKTRLAAALQLLPEQPAFESLPVNTIWESFEKYRSIDSLGYWGGTLAVRIALGNMYLDAKAEANKEYEYKISAVDATNKVQNSYASFNVSYPQKANYKKPVSDKLISDGKSNFLSWNIINGKKSSSFIVYRKAENEDNFSYVNPPKGMLTKKDTITYFVRDTSVAKGQKYFYYIIPTDALGNMSSASDTAGITAFSVAAIPLPDKITTSVPDGADGILLKWRLLDTKEIKSILVYRSEIWDSSYKYLTELTPNITEYLDESVTPMINYYYQIRIKGSDGSLSLPSARVSGILKSKYAPIKPTIVRSEGIKDGVKLEIICNDNFVEGYRIYRSNGFGDTLKQVGVFVAKKDSLTAYIDTASELSGKIKYGYSAIAENTSHVQSELAETVFARPLKSTNPPAPLFIKAERTGNITGLYWQDVRDIEPTVCAYKIYRRQISSQQQNEFVLITKDSIKASVNNYTDSLADEKHDYEYAVKSIDIFNNESALSSSAYVNNVAHILYPTANVTAESIESGVHLQWDEVLQPEITSYKIYRFVAGGSPVEIGSVNKDAHEFTDIKVKKDELYFYVVTSCGNDGLESAYSNEIGIRP